MQVVQKAYQTKILLEKQLNNYIKSPITQKIIPLIGFTLYFYIIPQILFRIIPSSDWTAYNLSQETAKSIIYGLFLHFGNFLTVIVHAIFMYFVYTLKIKFLQKSRVSPNKLWPWQEDPIKWRILLKKTIKTFIINTNVFGILSIVMLIVVLGRKVIIDETIPDYTTIFWQFIVFFLVQDTITNFTHKLLHSPSLYWIHKKHHQYTTSVSIAAQYAHPIQFIFSNSLPTIIGFKILAYFYPVHLVSAVTWLIFRILLTSDLHSGYEFPWDFYRLIPFAAPTSYHDFHHSHNVGNFASSLMIIEAFSGTNTQYYKYMELKNKQINKEA